MLLGSELMHLLGARSKLVWSSIATHRHCVLVSSEKYDLSVPKRLTLPGWLLSINGRYSSILRTGTHTRIHTIHGLLVALLRTLTHHQWGTSSWTGVTVDAWHGRGVAVSWRHERTWATLRKHHWSTRSQALGCHKGRVRVLHHDGTHGASWWHEISALRE
jgi:hypothetical protein